MDEIVEVRDDDALLACWPVMAQLRPHVGRDVFVGRVREQLQTGYRVACLRDGEAVVRAVAGYRIGKNLAWGAHLYVDDLATDAAERSRGHGAKLFAWLVDEARRNGCAQLHLDSGVARFDAHRFYLRHRMRIASHHFVLDLGGG